VDITKVTLRPVAMNKVCAIASVVIDDMFVVHDLRVVNGDKGLFVAMPSRKLPSGEFRDICHPINSDARDMIQHAVLEQFEAVFRPSRKRPRRPPDTSCPTLSDPLTQGAERGG
jgi:stage V sporulation protein G